MATSPEQLALQTPDLSPNDEAIPVRVTGATQNARVTVTAVLVDDAGAQWESEQTFVADSEGTVDVAADAPESGSYDGVKPMGWLWSMTTAADTAFADLGETSTVDVELRAATDEQSTERTITRVMYDEQIQIRPVSARSIAGTMYLPAAAGPHPGVMVLHGSGGYTSERFLRLLATHGFAVLSLQYFGEDDVLPDELARIPLSYFDDAAGWFREQPSVSGEQLGVVGMSRGAELALLLGSRFDWVGAVVSYAGSGVCYDTPGGQPAWVDGDDPVPHISGKGEPDRTEDGQVVPRPVLERGLDAADTDRLRAATIPVERTNGPVLLISGTEDLVWPAARLSAIAEARLADAGFDYDFEHLSYESAGHLISVPYAPLSGVRGGTPAGTAHAAADSWPTVLDYLGTGTPSGCRT